MAFARAVGELQSFSRVDLKLVALTDTMGKCTFSNMYLRSARCRLVCYREAKGDSSHPSCAVMAFARDVGELQSLSGVDLKLIALTHTLEKTAHGDAHLRSTAPTPKVHAKVHASSGKLPGWGTEGADWDALDKEPENQQAGADNAATHAASFLLWWLVRSSLR